MTFTPTRSTPEPSTAMSIWRRRVRDMDSGELPWGVLAIIGFGWLVAVAAQLSGQAGLLHHHTLVGGGTLPLWLAAMAFLGGWQVMVAGMMLPASLPAIRAFEWSRAGSLVGFLLAYLLAWTAFGLVAFLGDASVHRIVHATPWLAARPWLIEAAVLVVAGAYQLVPWKRRALAACRHPAPRVAGAGARDDGFAAGFRHAADCLASSWALMLLMFAAGFANIAWMAILAAVMAYEAAGRNGQRVASIFGVVLLCLAVAVVSSGLAGSGVLASLV